MLLLLRDHSQCTRESQSWTFRTRMNSLSNVGNQKLFKTIFILMIPDDLVKTKAAFSFFFFRERMEAFPPQHISNLEGGRDPLIAHSTIRSSLLQLVTVP